MAVATIPDARLLHPDGADHRIGLTIQNLTGILDGRLDELTTALQVAEQKERFENARITTAGTP